jgi:hypothetical protein
MTRIRTSLFYHAFIFSFIDKPKNLIDKVFVCKEVITIINIIC